MWCSMLVCQLAIVRTLGGRELGYSVGWINDLFHDEVVASIRAKIPDMFGCIKTNLIETSDERYATLIDVVVAAATANVAATRPQGVMRCCTGSSATQSHKSLMGLRIR